MTEKVEAPKVEAPKQRTVWTPVDEVTAWIYKGCPMGGPKLGVGAGAGVRDDAKG